ncbi:MAG TPA: hypothetical protein VKM55_14350 [Candidatus Lokiarchaeia archaeon]|nr:hypothetical protein [Candidatus Lokiarchaeia archaeon]
MYADSVTRDSIDPKKLALFFFVVGFGVSVDIAQQAYSFVYTQNPLYYAILNIIQVIFMGYVLLLLIYVTLIIYTHCPSGIKKNARWLLASSIVWPSFAIFGTFPIPIQTSMGIYNLWLSGHVAALGVLIIAYVFHKSPGLMHVLPFKTILLSVIDTNAGLAIFSHEWPSKNKIIGEDMFSGMIQGISLVVQEMVGRGTVREMVLDDGVFIFYRNIQHSLAFVLVASKSSKILRDSLQHFGDQFIADYAQYFGNLNEVSQFVGAADLVKKYFPYSN